MRKLIIIAAPLAMLATPALAQSVDGRVDITGTVAGRCLFTIPNETINLGELSDTGTGATAGKLDASRVNGQFKDLAGWCNNAAATMSVTTTALTNAATAATGFDNRVDYTATATANGVSPSDTSLTAGAGTAANVGMFNSAIRVTLSAASTPNNGLLVAGGYSGNVVVTLTPTVIPAP